MSGNFIDSNIIANYNKMLTGRLEQFNVPTDMSSVSQFEDILNDQMDAIGHNMMEGNVEFNDFSHDLKPQVPNIADNSAAGNMMENFKRGFGNALNAVNEKQLASQRAVETFATGGNIDVHEVMIAAEKASLSMQMALQMRNRMINFYNEFKNMNF